MLIGHYGASLLLRRAEPRLSVSSLFVAAQALDIVWSLLVLVGVERLRIVPGITATNSLDLVWMPYSHSLIAATVWGLVTLFLCRWGFRLRLRQALLLATAVFAHWPLDWLVHRPDLTIGLHGRAFGFGLWNFAVFAFVLEAGLLSGGIALYMRQTRAASRVGTFAMPVLALIMAAIQLWVFFGPVEMTARQTVAWALCGYILFPLLAALLETQRKFGRTRRAPEPLPWITLTQPRRRAERSTGSAKDSKASSLE